MPEAAILEWSQSIVVAIPSNTNERIKQILLDELNELGDTITDNTDVITLYAVKVTWQSELDETIAELLQQLGFTIIAKTQVSPSTTS